MGRGELAERQQRMGKVLVALTTLAEFFNLTVIITSTIIAIMILISDS